MFIFLVVGIAFSGCSSIKVNKITGVWTLERAPSFNLDLNQNIALQLKKYSGDAPTRILFQEDSVIFELKEKRVYQKCSYERTDNGFILFTFSDNKKTAFTFEQNDTRLSVMWGGRRHVYITGGLAL